MKTYRVKMRLKQWWQQSAWGVSAVVGGILIHLTLGNLYSFGNMMTYMVSYMHHRVDLSVSYANFIWVNSITTASQGLFMVMGGLLEKKIGPRLTCLIGCSCLSAGIMLTRYTVEMSLFAVILTYGLLAGLGISLSYATPLSCGMQWFPSNKGLVNGLIVAGFGLGALGSTNLQTLYLNPLNIPPQADGYFVEPSILDRVPSVFILLGVIFLAMQFIGCLLLNKPSEDQVASSHGQEKESLLTLEELSTPGEPCTKTQTPATTHLGTGLKPTEVIKEKTFYALWFIYFFNTIAVGYINAMYKSFGQTFISDDHFLAGVGSLAAVFNATGRVFWGYLMDKTSFQVAMRLLATVLSLLYATIPLTVHMGKIGFTVWLWSIFFTFSGTFVLMPTATEKAFGARHYSANYGLLFTSQTISGPLIAGVNQGLLAAFGFTGCFLSVSAIVVLTVCTTFLLPKQI